MFWKLGVFLLGPLGRLNLREVRKVSAVQNMIDGEQRKRDETTDYHGRVLSTHASHLRGPSFKFWSTEWLSFFMFSQVIMASFDILSN
jgi:hypothetical protein